MKRFYSVGNCERCGGVGWADTDCNVLCENCNGFGDAVVRLTIEPLDAALVAASMVRDGLWFGTRSAATAAMMAGRLA